LNPRSANAQDLKFGPILDLPLCPGSGTPAITLKILYTHYYKLNCKLCLGGLAGYSAALVMQRSRVQIPPEA
jgi:hypothetical protein